MIDFLNYYGIILVRNFCLCDFESSSLFDLCPKDQSASLFCCLAFPILLSYLAMCLANSFIFRFFFCTVQDLYVLFGTVVVTFCLVPKTGINRCIGKFKMTNSENVVSSTQYCSLFGWLLI